ncbi:MAG: hypothetical protein Q8936_06470 [Bacillota bacterium]|nr:hypothetical protein [Bacillota bacterium]
MKKVSLLAVGVVFSISLIGCSPKYESSTSSSSAVSKVNVSDEEILKVIDGSIEAANAKDLNKYMGYYDDKSEQYNDIKSAMDSELKTYDLKFTASDVHILTKNANDIQVQAVETVKLNKGNNFMDNKSLVIERLKKVDNKWKIYQRDIKKVEYFEPVYNVIYNSIQGANEKDITAFMAAFDQTNTDYCSKVKDEQQSIFDKYDVEYTFESASITDKVDNKVAVQVTTTAIKKSNSAFNNVRTTSIYHFKNVNNEWKITKIDIKSTQQLDNKLIAK